MTPLTNFTVQRVIADFFDLLDRRGIANLVNGCYVPKPHAPKIVDEFNILFRIGSWRPDQIQQLQRCIEAIWLQSKHTEQGTLFGE